MDNLHTHQSASLVEYVASACGIEADLGKKGNKHGSTRDKECLIESC